LPVQPAHTPRHTSNFWVKTGNKTMFHDFMKRDYVAPMRKTKIPIPKASCRVFRNFAEILQISVSLFHRQMDHNL